MTKNTAVLIRKPLTESLPMKLFGNSAETPVWLSGRVCCRTGRLSMRGFQSRNHSATAQNHHHSYTGAIFFCPAIPTICRWHLRLWTAAHTALSWILLLAEPCRFIPSRGLGLLTPLSFLCLASDPCRTQEHLLPPLATPPGSRLSWSLTTKPCEVYTMHLVHKDFRHSDEE